MLSAMKKLPYIVSPVVCIVIMLFGCKEQSITTAPAPDHQLLTETSYPAPSETAEGNSQTLMQTENTSQQSEKSYLAAILSGVRIVNEPDQTIFIDSNGEILWMIEDQYNGRLTFDTSGCYLLSGWYKDRYAEISKHSLKGEVLEIKSETYDEKLKAPDGTFNYLPSPSGDHLAYMVSSGEGGRGPADAEFLDVGIIDFEGRLKSTPTLLTSNGGGPYYGPAWSSTGSYLAYSDFDEKSIAQIFVYGVKEERQFQLSNFGEEMYNWRISSLSWSQDDEKVAFSAYGDRDGQSITPQYGIIGVLSNSQRVPGWVSQQTKGVYLDLYWKADESLLMAMRYSSGEEALIIFDGETGKEIEILEPILHEMSKPKREDILRKFIIPIGLGYIYETEHGIFRSSQDQVLLLTREILFPPHGPIDLSKCTSITVP
jgi:hypothetical protein